MGIDWFFLLPTSYSILYLCSIALSHEKVNKSNNILLILIMFVFDGTNYWVDQYDWVFLVEPISFTLKKVS